jgi:hypothetical protein
MAVTNILSKRTLSKRTVGRYEYAGVIDTIGRAGWGAYIDNKSPAYGPNCTSRTDANCQCCGDDGAPYYNCNTCNYAYVSFPNLTPSSSFNNSRYAGYYDVSPSTSLKKGFKSFAVTGYDGSAVYNAWTEYVTCTSCASTTEQNIIDAGAIFGDNAYAGIKEADDTLWTWGYNGYGSLGDGTNTTRKSPVQIGSYSWKMVVGSAYYGAFAAIRSDDTLWTWGANYNGQLGDNTGTNRNSPVQISGGGTWKYISFGYSYCMGIKSDDTLWGWGVNINGSMGDGTVFVRSSPVQVSGGGSWKHVSAGFYTTHAIKTNGTMYGFGGNQYTIGDGTNTNRSSPVQIGAAYSDWTDVKSTAVSGGAYAIRSNGTAYGWGYSPLGVGMGIISLITQIGSATNHRRWFTGGTNGYPVINNTPLMPFITTDGNLSAYAGYTSTQTSLYTGGGARQLITSYDVNYYGNNSFLMKYF